MRIWYQSFTDPEADRPYVSRLGEYLRAVCGPECDVRVFGIQPGVTYSHPITEFRCAAQTIANALTAQEQGYDAFVIGHFQEAGLAEARSAVRIPVIGLGEAAMLHACTLGRKIGLVATSPAFVQDCEDQIARHGLERRVVAVQALDPRPGQFNRAFDDEGEYRSVRDEFVARAEPMLALGVDVIIPAGGYPMLLFTREQSFAVGAAIVLNGLPVAVAAAETAVRLGRLNGTAASRRGAYALAPSGAVAEFRAAFPSGPPVSGPGSPR
jgi:allantoin racemase